MAKYVLQARTGGTNTGHRLDTLLGITLLNALVLILGSTLLTVARVTIFSATVEDYAMHVPSRALFRWATNARC